MSLGTQVCIGFGFEAIASAVALSRAFTAESRRARKRECSIGPVEQTNHVHSSLGLRDGLCTYVVLNRSPSQWGASQEPTLAA
ncbi:hypothetical protein F5X99DRAFT_414770 [Biscogniauxia marginata]|nr:hypothetical protein F5X99DRAFT_414770 [Biscogniauxia marginata]